MYTEMGVLAPPSQMNFTKIRKKKERGLIQQKEGRGVTQVGGKQKISNW